MYLPSLRRQVSADISKDSRVPQNSSLCRTITLCRKTDDHKLATYLRQCFQLVLLEVSAGIKDHQKIMKNHTKLLFRGK